MTCDDYREAIAADPSHAERDGHAAQCPACHAYLEEVRALDADIRRALAIRVPDLSVPPLPEVDTARVATLQPRRRRPVWFAMAAAVVAAAVVGVRLLGPGIRHETLAEQVLEHLDHEKQSLVVTDVPVPDDELKAVLPASVSTLGHSAGLVTYARSCEINGRQVPHLVIQGKAGPVTILLMPEEPLAEPVTLNGEHVNGVILPVGGGSIAIVGERDERLGEIEQKVLKSVTWTT